jgi:transcriptional regulator with GAF, ATPase, and Fis domain
MRLVGEYQPQFDSLKALLLDMGRERSVEALLEMIVGRLAERKDVALARLWLVGPGDICDRCPMRAECPDRARCLHLAASAGRPATEVRADWARLDGAFRRIPLGVGEVGQIASEGKCFSVEEIDERSAWIANPEWARREGVQSFGGQPLVLGEEILGVLAVFTRVRLVREGMDWLRMIADHAAAAVVNARAFEEVERLKRKLELENAYLREEVEEAESFGSIVGQSAATRGLLRQIELVAPTDASVLILGESGTGKELAAREIHKRGGRTDKPMIKGTCPAIPRDRYESEFFGHVRGAFTGALEDRAGRFELADGGTLYLDEVGEIPSELQLKLLRVLQEGQYERVGEERTRRTDVRIIAATNRDLERDVEAGRFRQDLYYRLNAFPIQVTPLRERLEDVPPLAAYFLEVGARKLNVPLPRLTRGNVQHLQGYDWPGNVRELQNVIERALITQRSGGLCFDVGPEEGATRQAIASTADGRDEIVPDAEMKRRERGNLLAALQHTDWKIYGPGGAAELLGVKPTTLSSRIRKMGLQREPRGSSGRLNS